MQDEARNPMSDNAQRLPDYAPFTSENKSLAEAQSACAALWRKERKVKETSERERCSSRRNLEDQDEKGGVQ